MLKDQDGIPMGVAGRIELLNEKKTAE